MAFQGDSIFWVEVEKIVPNPFQPRREFDEDKLKELAESIRMYGVLQPLTVTRKEVYENDGSFRTEYELIAGERRLRASRLAGLEQVPVIIRSGEQTEQEKLELAIIENLQREDLNAVDRALAFKQLADVFSLSHAQVAKKVGRSREYVTNSIRLLNLPDHILDALKRAEINEGHARTLLMLKERPEEQDVVFREIILKKLSVREVERITRKIATDKVRKKDWLKADAHLIEMERAFTDTLGTRVQISRTDFGGKLTIDYFSEDDLNTLLEVMRSRREALQNAMATPAETAGDEGPVVQTRAEADAALHDLMAATPLVPETSAPTPTESESPLVPVAFSVPMEEVATASESAPPTAEEPAVTTDPVDAPPSFAEPTSAVMMPTQEPAPAEPAVPAESLPEMSQSVASVSLDDMSEDWSVTSEPEPVPEPSPQVAKTEEPEDDLYSMKNFNL